MSNVEARKTAINRTARVFPFMAIALALVFVACAANAPGAETVPASYPETPEGVVEEFCRIDAWGIRAGFRHPDKQLQDVHQYVLWKDEPGWDAAAIITGYSVRKIAQQKTSARVSVTYQVAGMAAWDKFIPKVKKETVIFTLKRVGGAWKIAEPMIRPHISLDVMITILERIQDEADDPDIAKVLKGLKKAQKKGD